MYTQITAAERYTIARLRQHGYPTATIARLLGRHRSTIYREVRRNATRHDGGYRSELAASYARTRRSRSRCNQRFSPADWGQVHAQLREFWSPEQIAGRFRAECRLRSSHETICRHIWADKRSGGTLHTYLRGHPQPCRGFKKRRAVTWKAFPYRIQRWCCPHGARRCPACQTAFAG